MSKQQLESIATRIDCGELQILIWSHRLPSIDAHAECWTYLSSGMHQVGQPELVITLRRRANEHEQEFSLEPLHWFKMVYSWGKKNRIIDAYHTHEAHFEHFLGSKSLETLTYGMPMEIPGLAPALPPHRLHGIVLTKKEAYIAKALGYTRVIGHYGFTERWFSYCPWIDRDRDECVTMEQMKGTLRGQAQMKKVRALTVRWEGDRIILKIPVGREAEVKAAVMQTEPKEVWGLDSALDPDAGSCFYWESGQKEMRLYGGTDGVSVFQPHSSLNCIFPKHGHRMGQQIADANQMIYRRTQYCKGAAFIILCPQQPKNK